METIDQNRLAELEARETELSRRADAAGSRCAGLRAELDQLAKERHDHYLGGRFEDAEEVAERHDQLAEQHRRAAVDHDALKAAQREVAGKRQHAADVLRVGELRAARDEHGRQAAERLAAGLEAIDAARAHLRAAAEAEDKQNSAARVLHEVRHAVAQREDPSIPHGRYSPTRTVEAALTANPLARALANGAAQTGLLGAPQS